MKAEVSGQAAVSEPAPSTPPQPPEQDPVSQGVQEQSPSPAERKRWWQNAEPRLNLLVAGLLMLLSILFVSPGLPPGRVPAPMDQLISYVPWTSYYPEADPIFRGGDQLRQQLPWRYWAQHEWEAGRFPFWASAPLGGMSIYSSMQVGVLSPLHLIWALLGVPVGLGVVTVLKLWLAGFGMWGLLHSLRLHTLAALISSIGFMFSAHVIGWLPWQHSFLVVLLPWLLWSIHGWCINKSRWAVFGVGAIVASAGLGGHPEFLLIIGVTAALYTLCLLILERPRAWIAQLAALTGAVVIGFALSMVQILPFFEALSVSHIGRFRSDPGTLAQLHLDLESHISWFVPRFWGYQQDSVYPTRSFIEGNGYIGLVPLLGLPFTIVALVQRRQTLRALFPWLVIGLFACVVTYDEVVGTFIRRLPGFNQIINVRWLGEVAFAGLVLSAFGWDWVARKAGPYLRDKRPSWPAGAGLVLLMEGAAILVAYISGLVRMPSMEPAGSGFVLNDSYKFFWSIWAVGIALIAVGITLLWLGGWTRVRRLAPVGLMALLVLDLWVQMMPTVGSAPVEQFYPTTPVLDQIKALVPPTERILVEGDIFPTDAAMVYGIRDWRSQDPMLTERAYRAAALISPEVHQDVIRSYNMILENPRLHVAPLFGMRYYILPFGMDPNKDEEAEPGQPFFKRLAHKDGMGLWEAEGVPGFTYLSDRVAALAGEAEARSWVQNVTWEQVRAYSAFVEAPVEAVSAVQPGPSGTSPGNTTVLEYTPGKIRIRVDAIRPSLLVVAESFYPGWSAKLDGADVHILRTNYLSQGVVVPEGTHEVVFSHSSPALRNGALIAIVGLLGLLGLGLWAWRPGWLSRLRYRKNKPAGPISG